jgi:hypothetical protein
MLFVIDRIYQRFCFHRRALLDGLRPLPLPYLKLHSGRPQGPSACDDDGTHNKYYRLLGACKPDFFKACRVQFQGPVLNFMNSIVVGILAGYGDTPEFRTVYQRVNSDPLVAKTLVLFGTRPTANWVGSYLFLEKRSLLDKSRLPDTHRGNARTKLLFEGTQQNADFLVLLDGDTLPDTGYFEKLSTFQVPDFPAIMAGRLKNSDGSRCWDLCSFQRGAPIVVPYGDGPVWEKDLYLSGPQHIFNKEGQQLATYLGGYPAVGYGEDTHFVWNFKANGGKIQFIPDISATLTHWHTPPNYPE